jgi:hypothetical protein
VKGTARYPRTAKFLQFGGRFDSEGVALARIHILLCGWRLWCAVCACGLKAKVAVGAGRGFATSRLFGECCGLCAVVASGGHWGGRFGLMDFAKCEVECARRGWWRDVIWSSADF